MHHSQILIRSGPQNEDGEMPRSNDTNALSVMAMVKVDKLIRVTVVINSPLNK